MSRDWMLNILYRIIGIVFSKNHWVKNCFHAVRGSIFCRICTFTFDTLSRFSSIFKQDSQCRTLTFWHFFIAVLLYFFFFFFTEVRDLNPSFTTAELCQRLQICLRLSFSCLLGCQTEHDMWIQAASWDQSGNSVRFLERYVSSSLSPESFPPVTEDAEHRCT